MGGWGSPFPGTGSTGTAGRAPKLAFRGDPPSGLPWPDDLPLCMPHLRNEGSPLPHRGRGSGVRGSPGCQVGGLFGQGKPMRCSRTVTGLPGPQRCLLLGGPSLARPSWRRGGVSQLFRQLQLIVLFRPLPGDAKSLGPADSAPKPVQPVVWEKGAPGRGGRRCQKQSPQAQHRQWSLWGCGCCRQTLRQTDNWTFCLAMGLSRGQSLLLMPPLLLLTCLQLGTGLERINYVPQLSSATLAGRLTQSTLTLDQPRDQFSHLNISDFDAIWLVVAHSNATQNFTAPQRMEDTPVPADLRQRGYYLTLRANRALYLGGPPSHQLQVLRVGNDTRCSPRTRGCNHPLPGPGPYRVKFLVMSDRGPVAETEWSSETRLQQAEALLVAPGSQSAGAVVIIAILSVLLAVLLTALLALLIYTCYDTRGSTPISDPGELVRVRRYNTHHTFSPPAEGGS